MQRPIKFRAWDVYAKQMLPVQDAKFVDGVLIGAKGISWDNKVVVMQYTGLKDKNGDIEIYECDIIDSDGNVIGNQYETPALLEEETNLLIQGFGTKDWLTTYTQAVERGCHDT